MQEIHYNEFNVEELYEKGKVVILEGWEVNYEPEYRYFLEIGIMDINDPRLEEYIKIPVIPILEDGRNRGIRMSSKFTYDGISASAEDYSYVKYDWDEGLYFYKVYCKDALTAYIYGMMFKATM